MPAIRVVLPQHLQTLARVPDREVAVGVDGAVTIRSVLDALEGRFPQLRGTIRDHAAPAARSTTGMAAPGKRRPFVRFFACEEDWSHASPDEPLPAAVADGREPFLVVGPMAGG
jgi:molybdopterin synthase sulfur carrier subunit